MPVERLVFLGARDTLAPRTGAAFERITRHLAAWLTAFDCCTIFVPWRHDPHADHEAAALIGEAAARVTNVRLLAYPVWGWTLLADSTVQDHRVGGWRLEITAHLQSSVAPSRPMPRNTARLSTMIPRDLSSRSIC